MRIRRIRLKGVRSFALLFEHELYDKWNETVPSPFLVHGPNGSGKTTYLHVIAALWEYFGKALRKNHALGREIASTRSDLLDDVGFAGMQIEDFPGSTEPIWFFVASEAEYPEFKTLHAGEPHLGAIRVSRGREVLAMHSAAFASRLAEHRDAILDGRESDFPNVVIIPSEGRVLGRVPKEIKIQTGQSERYWLSEYDAKNEDIGSLLYGLKAQNPKQFQSVIDRANCFLTGKRITDFGPDLHLQVECGSGKRVVCHTIYELGSGEKQVLLLLAFAERWLRKGGVLLVDEPDLHLHVSITRQLVEALHSIAKERDGQMIITSHSPEVWEGFPRAVESIDLGKRDAQAGGKRP